MNDTHDQPMMPLPSSVLSQMLSVPKIEGPPMAVQVALSFHAQCVSQLSSFSMIGNQQTGQVQTQQAELLACQQQAMLWACRVIGKYFATELREIG